MGGGGFTHHGRRRIHYRIHHIIPSAREGGVQSRRRSSLSRSSRREAQDEKLKTRSSRREAQDVAAAIRAYRVTWSWEISRKQT